MLRFPPTFPAPVNSFYLDSEQFAFNTQKLRTVFTLNSPFSTTISITINTVISISLIIIKLNNLINKYFIND